ncbi:NodT family efflux transporter outer membrane factor (OMF) lipoprotein [Altererythrobacter atlanticus]|nr:efflux transporter outer membrane subunit [Croceibacterium atlanticum]MBB5732513.1 NodT family efflux transporter outer membrane factor (OMF) lipoprotein [Croceibacterium atlanticum]
MYSRRTVRKAACLAVCAGGVFSLGACSTAYIPPAQTGSDIPEQWAESDPAPVSRDIAEYWTTLDDPLVSEFVQAGLAENLDLAQSAARLEQARASFRQARAGWLPQINASGRTTQEVGDFAQDDLQISLGADASWEMDLFGRIGGNVAASQADLLAAGYSLADLQRLIVGQVAQATINAHATSLQLAIARDTLGYQDENLQIAQWRNQAGLVSSLDVEQARTQRAQTAATIPQLESNLAATANGISTLIGEPPGRVLALLADSAAVPKPPIMAGFEPPAEVLRRRPDVRGAEATLVAAGARVGVARAQLLPLVQLSGTVNTASVGLGDLFDVITGALYGSISQLIFDGGRTAAQIDSAEAAADGALAAWRQSILGALEDVESAAVNLRSARERVAIFGEALDAANNSAILARSQYQSGLTDFRTLLTAENQLLSARNSLIAAEAERANAFISLTQALGGGWSPDDYPMPSTDGIEQ